MENNQLFIPVICGSVRETGKSIIVSNLVADYLKTAGVKTRVINFKEKPLPFVYSEQPSKLKKVYPDSNVQWWSSVASEADGFVFVTPEYNHSFSAVLKNALDWLYPEFEVKAAGIVGVSSGMVGGARAIEALRPVLSAFALFHIRKTVMVRNAGKVFDAAGKPLDDSVTKQLPGFVESLLRAAEAMKQLRVNR